MDAFNDIWGEFAPALGTAFMNLANSVGDNPTERINQDAYISQPDQENRSEAPRTSSALIGGLSLPAILLIVGVIYLVYKAK